MKDNIVINSPPMSVTAQRGILSKKPQAFHRRDDLLGKNRLLRGSKARRVHNGRNKALDNIKEGHHQLQPIGHDAFGNGKPDKQFQRVLRLF